MVRTRGDELSAPLDQIGGQGVFVTEVESGRRRGQGGCRGSFGQGHDVDHGRRPGAGRRAATRADPRDGLVGCRLADLPPGGLIATGSARRRAQLAYLRPDLSFTEIRGNMERRVSRGEDGSVTAVVVAVAAMERLGWTARLTDILDPIDVLPQAGQGAIAVQCRADDGATRELLSSIDDVPLAPGAAGRAVGPGRTGGELLPCRSAPGRRPPSARRGCTCTVWWPAPMGARSSDWPEPGTDPELLGAEVARALLVDGGGSGIDGFEGGAGRWPGLTGNP